mmetsp:Transcript_40895/g.47544  ORF Transcript_40895/g.47544 Transcript_40895/m.47544 type:complete len:373 (+) Transcript_40895:109-1227(+)
MSIRMNVRDFALKRLTGLLVAPTAAEVQVPGASQLLIGTHDGSFHCDEAMACGLLRHTEQFAQANVVRTRVPAQHALCNIVVDVGSVYDASRNLLDHHQPEFQEKMHTGRHQYNTRLSSAGLVYRHFGTEIVSSYAEACVAAGALTTKPSEEQLRLVYDKVYKGFMEHVDGIDNGVEEFSAAEEGGKVVRNYTVSSTLSARVGQLYPRWNQASSRQDEDRGFVAAVELTVVEFFEALDYYLCSWLPARALVEEAFSSAAVVHESQQIVVLSASGCPWKEHLLDIEKESNCEGRTLYVLYSDGKGWRVQCVPKGNSSFLNRKPLPWKGLRDDELSKASGIDGGVFVHASGFIGGNKTFEGAKAMAIKALSLEA